MVRHATQGNDFLIPTPPLPPCAPDDLRCPASARSAYSIGQNAVDGGCKADEPSETWSAWGSRATPCVRIGLSKGTAIGGLSSMNRLLLTLAITAAVGSLLSSSPNRRSDTSSGEESRARRDHPKGQRSKRRGTTSPLSDGPPTTLGDGRAFRRRALRHGSQGPEPDGEISHTDSTGAIPRRFSACACPV